MRKFLNLTQDATIYQRFPNLNTGLDEILEVGKLAQPTDGGNIFTQASVRFLLDFDIISGSYPPESQYFLNLYIANTLNVNRYQQLLVHPMNSSWIEGSGYRFQDVSNVKDGTTWLTSSPNTQWNVAGGDFNPAISSSYEFRDIPITDVKIDVTNILSSINNGSASSWNGLIIKFPDEDEGSQINLGNIKFFSGNTHTVFEPRLEIVWDDQEFITGSLKPIPNSRVKITARNLKQAYTRGEVDKIYLAVRDPFPEKRFDAVVRYRNTYYLPSGSFFRITDEVSNVRIYDFDQFSTINCDPTGSYILLDTNGLEIDRFYKIELKVITEDNVFFPRFEYTFRVDSDGRQR
jgi:hypothetical protein